MSLLIDTTEKGKRWFGLVVADDDGRGYVVVVVFVSKKVAVGVFWDT
jgi:hypothetical protein